MVVFIINGTVTEKESGVPLSRLFVKAYDKEGVFDAVLGAAPTDAGGRFEIPCRLTDFTPFFDKRPDIFFNVYREDRRTLVHASDRALRWRDGTVPPIEIRIPANEFAPPHLAQMRLTADDGVDRESLEAGESLIVSASGLRPIRTYEIVVSSAPKDLFVSRLLTDARGEIGSTVLWPQMGMDDPQTGRCLTYAESRNRWQGARLDVTLRLEGDTVVRRQVPLAKTFTRPFIMSSDREGRMLNGFERGAQGLHLAMHNLSFRGPARVYMVQRQHDWQVGDEFEVARLSGVESAVRELDVDAGDMYFEFAPADALPLGAFDFVVRPLRYGYEEDELLRVLPRDVLSGRRTTGVVIREQFLQGKPVLGGCVNKIPISGRWIDGAPYFRYADAFEIGEDVWAGFDPGIVDPANVGSMCGLYVVPSKTEAQWLMSNSLTHLTQLGGNANVQRVKLQVGCFNGNRHRVWPGVMQPGEYDIVADMGANLTPDAMAFTPDNAYNTPTDIIDGYFTPGFRVLEDPGVHTQPGLVAGTWDYDRAGLSALGLAGVVLVDDENTGYASPGVFSLVRWQVALRARTFFPADMAGVIDPAQISTTKASYPLVVIVHGNGHSYTSYDFLLRHLAMNGFVAASIEVPSDMHGLGRGNLALAHVAVLRAKFGNTVDNNIGLMGHSRGGEGVVKAARLNQQQMLGNNINAVMALAPTDQYGREVFGGTFATPFFVLYGSRDGDIAGWNPQIFTGGYTWRMTGFSLYDRASGAPKSMAFVYRATHNGFITGNESGDNPISVADQQAIVKAYLTAFFRRHLRGEAQWDGAFTGEWQPASANATGAQIYFQYQAPGGKSVDNFEGPILDWQSSTVGASVSHGATLPSDPAENRMFDYPPNNPGLDSRSPHDTQGLKIRWDDIGQRLVWTIPAAHKDVTAFTVLSLRVTIKEGSPNNIANLPQDFRVSLKDLANNQRAIRVSAFAVVPWPDQGSNLDLRKSALTSVRVPLKAYTIVAAGAPVVDLQNIAELALEFTIRDLGEIEVDDIEFTN